MAAEVHATALAVREELPGAGGRAGLDLLASSRVEAVGSRVKVVPSVFGG